MFGETSSKILALATVRVIYNSMSFNGGPSNVIFDGGEFKEEFSVVDVKLKCSISSRRYDIDVVSRKCFILSL